MKPTHANGWCAVAGPFGIGVLSALRTGTAQAAICVWNSADGDTRAHRRRCAASASLRLASHSRAATARACAATA